MPGEVIKLGPRRVRPQELLELKVHLCTTPPKLAFVIGVDGIRQMVPGKVLKSCLFEASRWVPGPTFSQVNVGRSLR
jgi:hypothetical protein